MLPRNLPDILCSSWVTFHGSIAHRCKPLFACKATLGQHAHRAKGAHTFFPEIGLAATVIFNLEE